MVYRLDQKLYVFLYSGCYQSCIILSLVFF